MHTYSCTNIQVFPLTNANMHTSISPWLQPKKPGTSDNVGVLLAAWDCSFAGEIHVSWQISKL